MERDIIDIITEKEFIQLTASEKTEMQEFCKTEEEFNQMKAVFASINSLPEENLTPKATTKKDLDALFVQTYPKAAPIWYNSVLTVLIPKEKPFYRQPLLQVAAVALLIFLAVPLFNNPIGKEVVQVAENKIENTEQDVVEAAEESKMSNLEVKKEMEEEAFLDDNISSSLSENESFTTTDENSLDTRSFFNEEASSEPVPVVAFMDTEIDRADADSEDFTHPDGVFAGNGNAPSSTLSFSAAETEDLLDLLTTTF